MKTFLMKNLNEKDKILLYTIFKYAARVHFLLHHFHCWTCLLFLLSSYFSFYYQWKLKGIVSIVHFKVCLPGDIKVKYTAVKNDAHLLIILNNLSLCHYRRLVYLKYRFFCIDILLLLFELISVNCNGLWFIISRSLSTLTLFLRESACIYFSAIWCKKYPRVTI